MGGMLERSDAGSRKTGSTPVSQSKQDASVGDQWKCRGNCMGDMLERGMSMCNM